MRKTCIMFKRSLAFALIMVLMISCAPIALAESFSAIVTSGSMAVYKSAGLSGKIGTLEKGEVVVVTDYSGKVAKIKYNGYTGYAKISAMDKVEDVADEAVVSKKTRIYESASTKSKNAALKKGVKLYILETKGDWARVEKNGVVGFMNVNHLTLVDKDEEFAPVVTATPKPTAKVTVDVFTAVAWEDVKVYKSASTSSSVLGTLDAGTKVTVGAYSEDGWAYIRLNGKYGYCKYESLAKASSDSEPEVTAAPKPTATPSIKDAVSGTVVADSLVVYESASKSSEKLGTIEKGDKVNVIRWNDDWAHIEMDGKFGYCSVDGLVKTSELTTNPILTATPKPTEVPSVENAVKGTVTSSSLKVYKSASTSSKKLGTIYKGQEVNVLKWNGTWAYIELDGKYGYCKVSGLTKTSELETNPILTATPKPTIAPTATPSVENAVKGTVTSSSLKVYKTASTSSKKLGTIYKGQEVNVLAWNSTWAYIELDGKYGFCKVSGLTKTSELESTPKPTATPSLENAVKATVTDSTMKVYKTASTSSTCLGTLKKGREVNVLAWTDEWAYIELNGKYGFCKMSALTKNSDLPAEDSDKLPSGYKEGGFTATVIYPGAKVYSSASTDASSAALSLGQSVKIYAYNDNWACIVTGDAYGFVPVKYLNKTEYSTVKSSCDDLKTILKALLSYGYYDAVPSTSYNTAATTAIKRFQSDCGLSQTGEADQTMQRILFGGYAPTSSILSKELSKGDENSNVGRMQTRLYALGYLSKTSSVDSDYGSTTASAVKLFQSANGISASGTATVATLKALYSTGAKSLPSGTKAADASSSSSSGGSSSGGTSYSTKIPSSVESTTSSYSSSMSKAEKLEYVIYVGQQQLGKKYVYGAEGPNTFDCSGFTQYCFKKIGVSLKRSAYSQGYDSKYEKISSYKDLERGDLVFFNTISDSDSSDHAGIYMGKGYFIHASSGGAKVVISNLNSGYYNRVFSWGRRVL